jgi:hypothetical protein
MRISDLFSAVRLAIASSLGALDTEHTTDAPEPGPAPLERELADLPLPDPPEPTATLPIA